MMELDHQKLDLARARSGKNVSELAKACEMSRQRMSNILNSVRVSPVNAGKLAKALDVDVTEIIKV